MMLCRRSLYQGWISGIRGRASFIKLKPRITVDISRQSSLMRDLNPPTVGSTFQTAY